MSDNNTESELSAPIPLSFPVRYQFKCLIAETGTFPTIEICHICRVPASILRGANRNADSSDDAVPALRSDRFPRPRHTGTPAEIYDAPCHLVKLARWTPRCNTVINQEEWAIVVSSAAQSIFPAAFEEPFLQGSSTCSSYGGRNLAGGVGSSPPRPYRHTAEGARRRTFSIEGIGSSSRYSDIEVHSRTRVACHIVLSATHHDRRD